MIGGLAGPKAIEDLLNRNGQAMVDFFSMLGNLPGMLAANTVSACPRAP
jgi:hypothetical protein